MVLKVAGTTMDTRTVPDGIRAMAAAVGEIMTIIRVVMEDHWRADMAVKEVDMVVVVIVITIQVTIMEVEAMVNIVTVINIKIEIISIKR